MKKLLLILSLISLPLASSNSLKVSINGKTINGNDPKINLKEIDFDMFLTAKASLHSADLYNIFKYVPDYNKNEVKSNQDINVDGNAFLGTDTLVKLIMDIQDKNLKEHAGKELVICIGGNNGESSHKVYGITINDSKYIKLLSEIQNEGTDKKSICVIPKKITHKEHWSPSNKVVTVVSDIITLNGKLTGEEETRDVYQLDVISEMNKSTIFTTVTELNVQNKIYKSNTIIKTLEEENKKLKEENEILKRRK